MKNNKKIKIHVKNNHWAAGSFPTDAEGEKVFTIKNSHFEKAFEKFPEIKEKVEIFIDWDEDNFNSSMSNSDILLTWNFPTSNLKKVSPNLKWIHCISAGIEHLLPLDWMFEGLVLTNNSGVHSKKAGEYGLMSVLMLHNHIPKIVSNQKNKKFVSLFSTPIAGKTIVVVGTGNLGRSMIRLLAPLSPKIIGVNRKGGSVDGCSKVITVDKIDSILPFNFPGLGLIAIISLITLIGYLGSVIIASPINAFFQRILNRAPLLKTIYTSVKDMMNTFVGKKKGFSEPVLVKVYEKTGDFNGINGIAYLDKEKVFCQGEGPPPRIIKIDAIGWPYWPEGYLEKFWKSGKSFGVGTARDMPFLA